MENLHTNRVQRSVSIGCFGKCQSLKKVGGRRFIRRIFESGSLLFWSLRETKIEPDLQLMLLFIVRGIVNELEMA